MHDLVHDLALVISGQFIVRLSDVNLDHISTKVRHFSYVQDTYDDLGKFQAIKEAKWLRTFLALKPRNNYGLFLYFSKRVFEDILPTIRCSRVLSLSHYEIMKLPTSIGNLIHLRYLDLSKTKIEHLPEIICTLYNLQTLLLANCHFLTTLPVEMGKLICLRHLDISGTNLREMPMQMSRLKDLQQLTNFVVGHCSGSSISELKEFHCLRGKLSLSSLQNVSNCRDALEAKLKEKNHLEELVLEWGRTTDDSHNDREVLENLQPHTNLKHLTIKNYGGTTFPSWLGDHSYSRIVSLFLDKCDYCCSLPSLGQLSSLKHLNIARMNRIKKVGQEFYGNGSSTRPFQSLETLHFEEMSDWVDWYMLGDGEFSHLRELCIIKCPKLVGGLPKDIPSWVTLEIRECSGLMTSLPMSRAAGKLVLEGCDGVELGWQDVSSLVKLDISDMQSLKELTPELCALTNLKELNIEECPNLLLLETRFPPMLTCLTIKRCKAIQHFPEGMMHNNTCLENLSILGCSSLLSFAPDSIPSTLKYLSIWNCPNVVLPLSEEMERCYTSLESLNLVGCCCLSHLPLEFFPKLRSLFISDCKKFETLSIPNGQGLQNLASLQSLSINSCDSIVSFPQGGLPAPNLNRFELRYCEKLTALPEQMQTLLLSLQFLVLSHCPEIEFFPEGGLPFNLRHLHIYNCKKLLDHRREWSLQRLPRLTEFTLRCVFEDFLESFPEEGLLPSTLASFSLSYESNIQSLNNLGFQLLCSLKTLRIWDCPQLQSLPEEGLPASLERLTIVDCPQLQALPEKGLPPSLSVLEIRDCPLLKLHCQRDGGDDWHKIAHNPCVVIDKEMIS